MPDPLPARRPVVALAAATLASLLLGTAAPLRADDLLTVRVELADGQINTRRIEVPARQRFRVEVTNKGKTPAEFESLPLGLELVVAPGTYPFYDEFHMQTTQGVFVVK